MPGPSFDASAVHTPPTSHPSAAIGFASVFVEDAVCCATTGLDAPIPTVNANAQIANHLIGSLSCHQALSTNLLSSGNYPPTSPNLSSLQLPELPCPGSSNL